MQPQLRSYVQMVGSRSQTNQASSSKGAQGMSKPYSYAREAWNKFQANKASTSRGFQGNAFTSRKTKAQLSQYKKPRRTQQSFYNEQPRRKTT